MTVDGKTEYLFVFLLADRQYALRLSNIERVIRAVEVAPLPDDMDSILGVVNLRGRIIPVLNLRRLFHLPEREIIPSDHFVIAHSENRLLALHVDSVAGVVECPLEQETLTSDILPGSDLAESVVKLDGEMVIICDVNRLLPGGAVEPMMAAADQGQERHQVA